MPKKPTSLSLKDHDLLIGLDTKFDIFSIQISKDIAEVKDGVNTRITVLEQKCLGYDKLINEIDPMKLASMAYSHEKFINEFKLTWKLMLVSATIVGAITGFFLSIATFVLHFANFK